MQVQRYIDRQRLQLTERLVSLNNTRNRIANWVISALRGEAEKRQGPVSRLECCSRASARMYEYI